MMVDFEENQRKKTNANFVVNLFHFNFKGWSSLFILFLDLGRDSVAATCFFFIHELR